jgi:putative Holliday junction resolvase
MSNENKFKLSQLRGQNLLGVDYGEKVMGLALYKVGIDPFPMPFDRIVVQQVADPILKIKEVVEDEVIDRVIVGLPFLTDGTESTMTQKVRKWANDLSSKLEVPVHLQDETLSSYEAEERMKKDPRYNFKVDMQKIDALAASIIIEQFLQDKVDAQN